MHAGKMPVPWSGEDLDDAPDPGSEPERGDWPPITP